MNFEGQEVMTNMICYSKQIIIIGIFLNIGQLYGSRMNSNLIGVVIPYIHITSF